MYVEDQKGLGVVPVAAILSLPSVLGISIGGHYTGPNFVPDGVVNWAQQGHWDYITQVAQTGHGPHWSQPSKYPNGVNYDLSSAGNVGSYSGPNGTIPAGLPLGQWLNLFIQKYGPPSVSGTSVTTPAAQSPSYGGTPTTPTTVFPGGAPVTGAPATVTQSGVLGGVSTPMLLAGAAVLGVFVYAMKGRR